MAAIPNISPVAPDPPAVAAAFSTISQLARSGDASRIAAEGSEALTTLLGGITSDRTPIHVRVRSLALVASSARLLASSVIRKATAVTVKVIASEDAAPALLHAAIDAMLHLATSSPTDVAEVVARDTTDVLLQIYLADGAFERTVREGALAAVRQMAFTYFRAVVTKLLHWLSDERLPDRAEVLQAERAVALQLLQRLVVEAQAAGRLSEEDQRHVLDVTTVVLRTVTASEFEQLAGLLAALPVVKAAAMAPLIDAVVLTASHDLRGYEAICIVSRHLRAVGQRNDSLGLFMISGAPHDPEAMALSASAAAFGKAILVAALAATPEVSGQLFAIVTELLSGALRVIGEQASGLPSNLTYVEALLLTLMALAIPCGTAFLRFITRPHLQASLGSLRAAVAALRPLVSYAVKKGVVLGTATHDQAVMAHCLASIESLCAAVEKRHVVATLVPSWEAPQRLPLLAPPQPLRSSADDAHRSPLCGGKRARSEGQSGAAAQAPIPLSAEPSSSNNGGGGGSSSSGPARVASSPTPAALSPAARNTAPLSDHGTSHSQKLAASRAAPNEGAGGDGNQGKLSTEPTPQRVVVAQRKKKPVRRR